MLFRSSSLSSTTKSSSSRTSSSSSKSYRSGMSLVEAYLLEEQVKKIQEEIRSQSTGGSQDSLPSTSRQDGTARNPIVIEVSSEEEHIPKPYKRPEHLRPTFHPICERCHQYGHKEDDCRTSPRIFIRCEFCAWLKQPQRLCSHYLMSSRTRQRLRRNMGIPENPD